MEQNAVIVKVNSTTLQYEVLTKKKSLDEFFESVNIVCGTLNKYEPEIFVFSNIDVAYGVCFKFNSIAVKAVLSTHLEKFFEVVDSLGYNYQFTNETEVSKKIEELLNVDK